MVPDPTQVPTLFGVPLNRLIAFFWPQVSWLAGVLATWVVVHLHFLSAFHVTQDKLAGSIAQALVFGVVTLVTWLGGHKWLDGFQKWAYGVEQQVAHTQLPGSVGPPQVK